MLKLYIYIQTTARSKYFIFSIQKQIKSLLNCVGLPTCAECVLRDKCNSKRAFCRRVMLKYLFLLFHDVGMGLTIKPSPYFKLQLCFPLAPVKYSASMNFCIRAKILTYRRNGWGKTFSLLKTKPPPILKEDDIVLLKSMWREYKYFSFEE